MRPFDENINFSKKNIDRHIYVVCYAEPEMSNVAHVESPYIDLNEIRNIPNNIVALVLQTNDLRLKEVLPYIPDTVKSVVFEIGVAAIPQELLDAIPFHLSVYHNTTLIRGPISLPTNIPTDMDVVVEEKKDSKKRACEFETDNPTKKIHQTNTPFNLFNTVINNNFSPAPQHDRSFTMDLC